AIFAKTVNDSLLIDELCISCRALGRNVESPMVALALLPIMDQHRLNNLAFKFCDGPRNLPARNWLSRFTGVPDLSNDATVAVAWDAIPQRREHLSAPIASKWEHTRV